MGGWWIMVAFGGVPGAVLEDAVEEQVWHPALVGAPPHETPLHRSWKRLVDEATVPELVGLIDHEQPIIRYWAVRALGARLPLQDVPEGEVARWRRDRVRVHTFEGCGEVWDSVGDFLDRTIQEGLRRRERRAIRRRELRGDRFTGRFTSAPERL